MTNDNFKWTDELVKEFARAITAIDQFNYWNNKISDFKASHTSAIEDGRDWEIVVIEDKNLGKVSCSEFGEHLMKQLLKIYTIHSVLRKKDSTVWTVGEGTMDGTIERFELYNEYHIKVWLNGNKYLWLHTLEKFPQPLPQRTKPVLLHPRLDAIEERIAYIEKKLNIEG